VPLTLFNPTDEADWLDYDLREHVGGIPDDNHTKTFEKPLRDKSLIKFGKDSKAKLLICITQYNEPLFQLIESLAGIYRAYYELGK